MSGFCLGSRVNIKWTSRESTSDDGITNSQQTILIRDIPFCYDSNVASLPACPWEMPQRNLFRRPVSRRLSFLQPFCMQLSKVETLTNISEFSAVRTNFVLSYRASCKRSGVSPGINLPYVRIWARCGAGGWGTALQAGRSRVRFPMVSLEFFIDIILPTALRPWHRLSL